MQTPLEIISLSSDDDEESTYTTVPVVNATILNTERLRADTNKDGSVRKRDSVQTAIAPSILGIESSESESGSEMAKGLEMEGPKGVDMGSKDIDFDESLAELGDFSFEDEEERKGDGDRANPPLDILEPSILPHQELETLDTYPEIHSQPKSDSQADTNTSPELDSKLESDAESEEDGEIQEIDESIRPRAITLELWAQEFHDMISTDFEQEPLPNGLLGQMDQMSIMVYNQRIREFIQSRHGRDARWIQVVDENGDLDLRYAGPSYDDIRDRDEYARRAGIVRARARDIVDRFQRLGYLSTQRDHGYGNTETGPQHPHWSGKRPQTTTFASRIHDPNGRLDINQAPLLDLSDIHQQPRSLYPTLAEFQDQIELVAGSLARWTGEEVSKEYVRALQIEFMESQLGRNDHWVAVMGYEWVYDEDFPPLVTERGRGEVVHETEEDEGNQKETQDYSNPPPSPDPAFHTENDPPPPDCRSDVGPTDVSLGADDIARRLATREAIGSGAGVGVVGREGDQERDEKDSSTLQTGSQTVNSEDDECLPSAGIEFKPDSASEKRDHQNESITDIEGNGPNLESNDTHETRSGFEHHNEQDNSSTGTESRIVDTGDHQLQNPEEDDYDSDGTSEPDDNSWDTDRREHLIWGYQLEATGGDRWTWINRTRTVISDQAEFRRRLPTAEARRLWILEYRADGVFGDNVGLIFHFDPFTWQQVAPSWST